MRWSFLMARLLVVIPVLAGLALLWHLYNGLPDPLTADASRFRPALHAVLGALLWLGMAWLVVQVVVRGIVSGLVETLLGRPVPGLVKDLLRVLIYGSAIVAVLSSVLGLPVAGVLATTGAVGVVLGFALRDMIADFFSGIAINLEEPYLIGETIGLDDGFIGRVTEITWRTTRLVSADEISAVVPNGRIGLMVLRNYSRPAQPWRAQLELVLEHGVPVQRVRRVLEAAVRGVDQGLNRERAQAHVLKVDLQGVHYLLYYWVTSIEEWSPLRTRVQEAAMAGIYHAGLSHARPRTDVHLLRNPVGQADDSADCHLQLGRLELLHELSGAELALLAEPLRPVTWQPGARVVCEGDPGDSLFLVLEGLLDVHARSGTDADRTVASLHAGDFFGEFSLLTGEARSASVECVTECRLMEIRRADLEPILEARPELARLLSRQLAERRLQNRRALLHNPAEVHHHYELAERMLKRIRELFRLDTPSS
jgi:small-conductance mechanosensitive channel/CRP-like cAMP-binding protein